MSKDKISMDKSKFSKIIKYALITICMAGILGLGKLAYNQSKQIEELNHRIITLEVRDQIMFNI